MTAKECQARYRAKNRDRLNAAVKAWRDRRYEPIPRLDLPAERWLPVVGWEGWYEVSTHGRVRRLTRAPGTRIGYCLKPLVVGKGYHAVRLHRPGAPSLKQVHRLVAEAFIGPPPDAAAQVNHKDLNKAHNALSNLEWVTGLENMRHAARHGRFSAPRPRPSN